MFNKSAFDLTVYRKPTPNGVRYYAKIQGQNETGGEVNLKTSLYKTEKMAEVAGEDLLELAWEILKRS